MVCYDMCKSQSVCISWYSCWWLYCTTQKKILKMRRIFILYKNKLEIELEVDIESKLEMRQVRGGERLEGIATYMTIVDWFSFISLSKQVMGKGVLGVEGRRKKEEELWPWIRRFKIAICVRNFRNKPFSWFRPIVYNYSRMEDVIVDVIICKTCRTEWPGWGNNE